MLESLDKLVQLAQVSGGVNVQCRFEGEWFVQHDMQPEQAVVHIVVSGSGYMKRGSESLKIKKGDILFFSRSDTHILSSQKACANRQDVSLETPSRLITLKQTGSGQALDLQLFCAHFYYDKHSDLFHNLPAFFQVNVEEARLMPIICLLQQEVEKTELGSQQVIDSLSNVLLIAIIRAYLAKSPERTQGVLSGIFDHRLRGLIEMVLREPERDWSIENMVAHSPLSRAQLIRVFKQKLGLTPHAFVQRSRLQKAALWLKQRADSVLMIALSCGFQSETHFIKVFKAHYGITPSLYRKSS